MTPSPPLQPSRTLLPGLLLAVTLHAFHAMAVVTIAPLAVEELDGRAQYGAFFAVYLLATLLGLTWAGSRVASAGPGPVLGAGFAAFSAGILGAGLASSMSILVATRAVEGFGGGVATSVIYTSVNRAYDDDARPGILAWLSAAWVLPGLLGPPVAGLVAETWSWRWVFIGVLPAVGLAAALALPALRGLAPATERPSLDRGRGLRTVLLVAGLGALLHALATEPSAAAALLGALGLGLAVSAARRILPAGTLSARPVLPAAVASKLLLNFAFFGTEAFLPLALAEVRGWSTFTIGTVLTTGALAWTAGAFLHARLARHMPGQVTGGLGMGALLVAICGLIGLLLSPAPGVLAHLVWALAGAGMGLAYNTTASVAMEETPPGQEGGTSTALGMADALGFGLAAGIGGAILSAGDRLGWSTAPSIAALYVLMAGVACLTLAVMTRMQGAPSGTSAVRAEPSPS